MKIIGTISHSVFFEFTTLAIFYICKKQNLDILLLEVGLGGRLDAVNIVEPDVAVITTIDIDHTDWLGEDRESIGREKAGIIRRHKPVIGGDPNLPNSVYEQVHLLEAPFYQLEKDFFCRQYKRKLAMARAYSGLSGIAVAVTENRKYSDQFDGDSLFTITIASEPTFPHCRY